VLWLRASAQDAACARAHTTLCAHVCLRPQVRFKIMRNIGLSFVRMGQYPDALQAFATVMDNVPDHQVRRLNGFHELERLDSGSAIDGVTK
jgi:hypothetical protein